MEVSATFAKVTRLFPSELRAFAATLPHRLGLTAEVDGDWTQFAELESNRDLPSLVAKDLAAGGDVAMSEQSIDAFTQAHHAGGFAMLVADRLADEQVAPDPRLSAIRRLLVGGWAELLGDALASPALGRQYVAVMVNDWRKGVALERALLHARCHFYAYARACQLKLRWISGTARAMLAHVGLPARARLLESGYTRFLFALQCRDDVRDEAEDTAARGISIPAALDMPAAALVRAAPLAGRRSAQLLRQGGFLGLANIVDDYTNRIDGFLPGGVPLRDQLLGMSIVASYDEQCEDRNA